MKHSSPPFKEGRSGGWKIQMENNLFFSFPAFLLFEVCPRAPSLYAYFQYSGIQSHIGRNKQSFVGGIGFPDYPETSEKEGLKLFLTSICCSKYINGLRV